MLNSKAGIIEQTKRVGSQSLINIKYITFTIEN